MGNEKFLVGAHKVVGVVQLGSRKSKPMKRVDVGR